MNILANISIPITILGLGMLKYEFASTAYVSFTFTALNEFLLSSLYKPVAFLLIFLYQSHMA
jgi:hypothetical protein